MFQNKKTIEQKSLHDILLFNGNTAESLKDAAVPTHPERSCCVVISLNTSHFFLPLHEDRNPNFLGTQSKHVGHSWRSAGKHHTHTAILHPFVPAYCKPFVSFKGVRKTWWRQNGRNRWLGPTGFLWFPRQSFIQCLLQNNRGLPRTYQNLTLPHNYFLFYHSFHFIY